jgi:ribonuclease D
VDQPPPESPKPQPPQAPPLSDILLAAGIPASLSKEAVMQLPIRRYEGPIQVVRTNEEADWARVELDEMEGAVGFDTETRPTFVKGQWFPPSVVQVATADKVYLFQLGLIEKDRLLQSLLGSEKLLKVGIALDHDIKMLHRIAEFESRSFLDLGTVVKKHGVVQLGLRSLTGMFLGFRVSKQAQVTDWSRKHLSDPQIQYAATDAWVSRELYLRFVALGLL